MQLTKTSIVKLSGLPTEFRAFRNISTSTRKASLPFDTEGNPVDFPSFRGFPQCQITLHDWTNLQYLVIKIPYADASIRDEFNKPSIVKICIPSVLVAPLNQMIDIQGNSHVLRQLSKARYDFVHIPKIGGGKVAVHTIKVAEMSRAFLSAMQVWGEAAGPCESEVDLEVARAFNIFRHFAEERRREDLEAIVASVAAQGGVAIKEE